MVRWIFQLTRLAVIAATQPFSKRMRALAMSSAGPTTGTPTASIRSIGLFTRVMMLSISCTIMSRMTLVSVPRPRYCEMRVLSI